jgi:hypothetical protein
MSFVGFGGSSMIIWIWFGFVGGSGFFCNIPMKVVAIARVEDLMP